MEHTLQPEPSRIMSRILTQPVRPATTRPLLFLGAMLVAGIAIAQTEPATKNAGKFEDPNGVLLQPIPNRLVVLTFDDGCASGYAVVAPILKSLGFGGTFYVCDFDSFKTRKDWYLTWRQMKALHDQSFEIGNHTVGHWGGLGHFLDMEDELLANNVPKPTTVCWPIYDVNWNICPALTTNGYTFGRGGHERPYRPAADNPFDVPSFSITDGTPIENFIKQVQQACQTRVVVLTFHGVPDMEHPPVSLEPATFKAMMQYLKDNHYQCIALRDMTKYIDPVKAANLPHTPSAAKGAPPFERIKDEKPYVAPLSKDILEFRLPGLPPANVSKTSVRLAVPHATDVTALVPNIRVSPDATVAPASGASRDFSTAQTYTVTARDGSTKSYVVTVKRTALSDAKDMLTFTLPGVFSNAVSGNSIALPVPANTDLKALAPTFVLSPLATAVPPSGTTRDFTSPQSYTLTAQDGSSHVCTVTVVKSSTPIAFTWSKAEGGNWSDAAKWSDNLGSSSAPQAAGQSDYFLRFNQSGAVTNDLNAGFLLNQLVLGDRCGGMILRGSGIAFTKESAAGILPVIHAGKCQRVDIDVPLTLRGDLTVNTSRDKDPNCFISFNEVISGPCALILNSPGDPNVAGINFHDVHFGILQLNNRNTYSGGTFINGGKINVRKTGGLGTGTVTLDKFGTLSTDANLTNPVVINQGTLFHCALSGPVKLNGIANFIGNCSISGGMSGPGGFAMLGINGTYLSMVPGGTVTLLGPNTYTGPTTIFPGTLLVKKAAGLYNGDATKWTPENITIHKAATLRLNVGGPGEFTGGQVGTLIGNLTRAINHNGLTGGSSLTLDTANAREPITVSASLSDSKGPGGGAFIFRKCGAGAMRLSGDNTYTGRTILESGTLIVSSLNSFTKGKGRASSSMGAPIDIEAGELVIGDKGKDGDGALVYTGPGETSDRVMNLAGKNSTVTIDQSGNGLFKLTSTFVISGYGACKTIVLQGDTAGTGEIAGSICNPHDRAGNATTAVTKSGTGTWTLSGTNSYNGRTTVTKGTLSLANARSLGDKTEVHISDGATLALNFGGEVRVRNLYLDGKLQPAGTYGAANAPRFIKGTGALRNE
jgi:autotransporter-associated beta strand protein